MPRADTIAVLVNPNSPATQTIEAEARAAAQLLGLRVTCWLQVRKTESMRFGAAIQRGVGALLVGGDAYFNKRRAQVIALAARHGLPANFDRKEIAIDGGLMSYGMNNFDMYRQIGIYTGQILKARSLPICRSSSRQKSSLSLISKRPDRSASNCRRRATGSIKPIAFTGGQPTSARLAHSKAHPLLGFGGSSAE